MIRRFFVLWLMLFSTVLLSSCSNETDSEIETEDPPVYLSSVKLPEANKAYVEGQKIPFHIVINQGEKKLTELVVSIGGKKVFTTNEVKPEYMFDVASDSVGLGNQRVKIDIVFNDKSTEPYNYDILILSNTDPQLFSYTVVHKYPHDTQAYTQGLYFEKGLMYEGTGLRGKSELRLVDFRQNKIIQSKKLDNMYFGEGVAIVHDKIFQLTYQEKKVFVYDKKTFDVLNEFSCPTEGWGLTFDGQYLISTDGSNNLYYHDTTSFALVKTVQVVDNKGPVNALNELEYINGELWANVYQTDMVLRIDPKTGKVLSRINFEGLLTDVESLQVDVLNGIAYDPKDKKLYVTGKLWPWLFEVQLKEITKKES